MISLRTLCGGLFFSSSLCIYFVCVRVYVSLGRFEFGVPVGRVVPDVLCYVVLALILVLIANVS